MRNRDSRQSGEWPQLPPIPTGFKVWTAIVAVLGLTVLGVVLWAVITLVNHYT